MKYNEEWTSAKCDKYDYLIAAFSGMSAGLIDIFFVGAPGKSGLCNFTDAQADKIVMKFSKSVGWSPRAGQENNVASAIGFLEKKYPVNYDQAHKVATGGVLDMAAKNHHFKSLSHSPDLVGLFFSILDQFQGKSTFLSDGQLIRIDTTTSNLRLEGGNLYAKIFCGFCNWLGHIMSDLAGSSGGRRNMTGRGSGVAIPFMPMFQMCDFGQFNVGEDVNTLATVMTKVFQEGYDLRFGAAMAVPVILNELLIRVLWVIKNRFYEKKEWKDCIPSQKHADLRIMLIVGHATLCLMDGLDAGIRSGGNVVTFILRLNLIAWVRLLILVFKELRVRYGEQIKEVIKSFFDDIWDILTNSEKKLLYEYNARMEALDKKLSIELNEFIDTVNKEYLLVYGELEATFNEELSYCQRVDHSVKLAEICGVDEENIVRSDEDLFAFFEN